MKRIYKYRKSYERECISGFMKTSNVLKSECNGPFPSCFEPHYDSEVRSTVFVMKRLFIHVKITFVCI